MTGAAFARWRPGWQRVLLVALVCRVEAASPWPVIQSDLPGDPAVRAGELPNGLRYAILANGEPKDRISLRLLVATGSLYEHADEQGFAHFVEHLMFRGTRTHPGDSLNELLERQGIGYGPDSNAATNYTSTVFRLELPNASEATLSLGLETFREYCAEALIASRAVGKERGVILSERATRLTPDSLVQLANLEFLWPGSLPVRRVPIGFEPVIKGCTRRQLERFYDTWYRPERLAVVVVGDMAPDRVEPLVRDAFKALRARGAAENPPEHFEPDTASQPDVHLERDYRHPGVSFLIEHPFRAPRVPDTHAHRTELLDLSLAMAMLQSRLEKYAHGHEHTFVAPAAYVSKPVEGWRLAAVGANSDLTHWNTAIGDLEKEHRQAFLFGFTDDELRLAKATFTAAYAQAVRSAASRASSALADQLVDSILNGEVFTTPAALQQDVAPAIEAATPAECLAALRGAWTASAPHVFVAANSQFASRPVDIAAVLNLSRKGKVEVPHANAAVEFAYTDFGPRGQIVREEAVADLDVRLATLANGVRFNFKATTFTADSVDVFVRIGTGKLSQPRDQPGLDLLADQIVIPGGLSKHSSEQINDLIAGHSLAISFGVVTDACVFSCRCARRDLRFCLQLISAYLTDAAFRPEALTTAGAAFGSMYANLAAAPGGAITRFAPRLMAGNDPRFGVPDPDILAARTPIEVIHWLEPQFKHGPIELAIVGDTTWAEAAEVVADTLGALPERQTRADPALAGGTGAPRPEKKRYLYLNAPTVRLGAMAWLWPAPNCSEAHQERRYVALAQAITERLRARIRGQLGAAYSPEASLAEFEGFPQLGYVIAYVEIPPDRAAEVTRLVNKEISRLRSHLLDDDEFQRIKGPLVRARADDIRTNEYWAATVLPSAQQDPRRLAAARDRQADFAAITSRDIQTLAERCLDSDACVVLMAGPPIAASAKR